MASSIHLVVCRVDEQRVALPLTAVKRVLRAVEVTPLPGVPRVVLGVINIQGKLVPVISLRRRCQLPEREIELTDQLVIAETPDRQVALLVDAAETLQCDPAAIVAAETLVPGIHGVRDVVKQAEGIILLYHPTTLLETDEEAELGLAMPQLAAAPTATPVSAGGATWPTL